jgi:ribosome recycling factor
MSSIPDLVKHGREQMGKAVESTQRELGTIRSGKASPAILDLVRVEAYGALVPLNQVAMVAAPEPRLLTVQPFDKGLAPVVEKAIRDANLGLNPASQGNLIRVPLPALTEERRRDLTKVVRHEGESARVAIRNVRRDVMQELKEMLKEKLVSEDVDRKAQEEVQKLTDKYVAEVDHVLAEKEKELMQV